jgi:hypothetical protein
MMSKSQCQDDVPHKGTSSRMSASGNILPVRLSSNGCGRLDIQTVEDGVFTFAGDVRQA